MEEANVKPFERCTIINLLPGSAEEAKKLVPSLEVGLLFAISSTEELDRARPANKAVLRVFCALCKNYMLPIEVQTETMTSECTGCIQVLPPHFHGHCLLCPSQLPFDKLLSHCIITCSVLPIA